MRKKLIMIVSAMLAFSMIFTGCMKGGKKGKEEKKSEVVLTVNNEHITKDEFDYYMLMAKSTILAAAGGEDTEEYWTTTEIEGKKVEDVVKEKAMQTAIEITLTSQKAVEMGADNSESVRKVQRENFIVQTFGSEEDYLARMKELELTDEGVTTVIMKDYLTTQLYDKVELDTPTDEQIKQYYDENYLRAKHILIAFSEHSTEGSDGKAEALVIANEVKAKLDAGADFDSLIPEYNNDPGMEANPDGYVFTKDVMVKPFEDATRALEIGGISDIVETDYGFHIIMRLDAAEVYDKFLTDVSSALQNPEKTGRDEIASFVEYSQLEGMIEEWKEAAEIKTNDEVLKSISVVKK